MTVQEGELHLTCKNEKHICKRIKLALGTRMPFNETNDYTSSQWQEKV